jgi:ABC-type phosphate transport system ATPase subunit
MTLIDSVYEKQKFWPQSIYVNIIYPSRVHVASRKLRVKTKVSFSSSSSSGSQGSHLVDFIYR